MIMSMKLIEEIKEESSEKENSVEEVLQDPPLTFDTVLEETYRLDGLGEKFEKNQTPRAQTKTKPLSGLLLITNLQRLEST